MAFTVQRGVNISHWLSRSEQRGAERAAWFTEQDVRYIAGLPLYCGEFGCYTKTPQPIRLAWYADMMATFKEHDIAWANWDYKGSFGIVTADGQDTGLAEVLLS